MAANKKFTPRASANLIEGEVTETKVEETEISVDDDIKADTEKETESTEVVDKSTETEEDSSSASPEEEDKKKKAEEVTFTAQTDKKPIERMVKICLAKKYDGCIGGVWYHFAKDQVVTVPENVKRILIRKEGMLKPL